MWQLIAAGVGAAGMIAAGRAAEESARLDAFNIETQKGLAKTET